MKDQKLYLNKFISNSGFCSRRNATELIKIGKVFVNNFIIKEPFYIVKITDVVRVANKVLKLENLKYFLFNKPKNVITTLNDEFGRKSIADFFINISERLYPIGRLDKDTTGLIILTNDGEFAQKLSHPKFNISKTYKIILNKDLEFADFEKIKNGIYLFDGFIKPDSIKYLNNYSNNSLILKIHSGRNRIIKRIFERFGLDVKKLDRIEIEFLSKKNLKLGEFRNLSKFEIEKLKKI